ncbi:FAD-dependent monooxygenase [Marinoscillum sp.]|uniref:FAD-dependent monooxygenase n=1 Tax=Marinoscillum sp. TaxID=2024838 RepID=UPI003BAD1D80
MKHLTITIIGGGIAGLCTALALQNRGIRAEVFEASPKLEPVGAGLGLGANAMLAFKELGIYDDVVRIGRSLPSFTLYDHLGKRISHTSFDPHDTIGSFTIHRASLHELLLSRLDPAQIHLGKRVVKYNPGDFSVGLTFDDGSTHRTNYLIVADGIHSTVRQALLPASLPRYSGYTCWRAVIDNRTPGVDHSSETWGPKGRIGLVPLPDDQLYWFICINARQGALKHYGVKELFDQLGHYHAPIPEVLAATEDRHLIHNDIIDLKPLDQFAFGRTVLIGDAAHATTPNMGQGACQAIEDAVVLGQCVEKLTDTEEAFRLFEQRRLSRTRWIVDTSWRLGKAAQLENGLLIGLRNAALRCLPPSVNKRQLEKLKVVDFMDQH